MAGWSGVLIGALGLAALEVAVSSGAAVTGFGALVQLPGQWAQAWMDPGKPLLPNFAKAPCAEGGNVNVFSMISSSTDASGGGSTPVTVTPVPYNVPTSPSVPTPTPTPVIST